MHNQFSRTELLLGREAMERLSRSRVAVFGVGGVGGYVVEALVRSGVGSLDLIDDDVICLSNINRQIYATHSTIGRPKVEVARERCLDINPDAVITVHRTFYLPETAAQFDFTRYDYVVDAIDTVTGKLALAEQAHAAGTPLISSMGAGNKLDPTAFEVADIYETSVCPLARVMRRELKKRGIPRLKVVYSREPALVPLPDPETSGGGGTPDPNSGCPDTIQNDNGRPAAMRRSVPGSTAFVPSVAGLIIAGEIIRDLTAKR
ncbi:MAG: tRNA threonylcarbamoyladenosine dehydratase [Eubacteriales bacterium]|nr:tRNA threonylcarbamoyladenosine dehydratase [Eubacteriales bacterium]